MHGLMAALWRSINIIKTVLVPDEAEQRHDAYGEPNKEKYFHFSLKDTWGHEAAHVGKLDPQLKRF
jgi:hypothetical protein